MTVTSVCAIHERTFRFQDIRVAAFKLVLLSGQARPHEELQAATLPLRVRLSG